jgi:hypothetical protein
MKSHLELISRYRNELMNLEHVIGIGYGLKEKSGKTTYDDAIIILVDKKLPINMVKKQDLIPHDIEDYKTDVIEIGELNFFEDSSTVRISKMRPAKPGVSIGHYKITAGTFGAVVKDKKTGELLILSNNHILANISNGNDNRAKPGDVILQPGVYDKGVMPNDIIAHLERFIPIEKKEGKSECPFAIIVERISNSLLHIFKPNYNLKFLKEGTDNIVDCAVAKPVSSNFINEEIFDIGKVKGCRDAEVGMKIQKSGRTSGITTGRIRAIDATVEVKMSETEVAVFSDQFVTDAISKPGDSGSLVLDMDNNAVGLLFAGSDQATVCNKITNIMDALEVEF